MNYISKSCFLFALSLTYISHSSYSQSSAISLSLGGGFNNNMTIEDQNPSSSAPPALFGGGGRNAKGENNDLLNIGLSFSYQVQPWLDLEVRYDYQGMTFNGNSNFTKAGSYQPTTTDIRSDGLFFGGKFNFQPLLKDTGSNINPFFSAGIGVTKITTEKVHFSFPTLQEKNNTTVALTTTNGGANYNGAFRVGLGFDWPFHANWGTSVSYHFYHLGEMETDEGAAYVYGHGFSKDTQAYPLGSTLYVDGLKAKIQTNILSIDLWRRF